MIEHPNAASENRGLRGLAVVAVTLCCSVALLLLLAANAAASEFSYSSTFDSNNRPGLEISGVAVDNSTNPADPSAGDVYVADGSVVNKYTPAQVAAGSRVPADQLTVGGGAATGIAVDPADGSVYVTESATLNGVYKFAANGDPIAGFSLSGMESIPGGFVSDPTGIVVNPSNGHFYLGSVSYGAFEFDSSGAYTGKAFLNNEVPGTRPGDSGTREVALDSAGDLYLANESEGIAKFTPSGVASLFYASPLVKYVSNGNPVEERQRDVYAVAVDPSTQHVFAISHDNTDNRDPAVIYEYDPSGSQIGEPFAGDILHLGGRGQPPLGIAFDASGFHLYLAAADISAAYNLVSSKLLPSAITGSASNVDLTTATLTATVGPAAVGSEGVTGCQFEYGTSKTYDHTAPCSPSVPFTGTTSVSASITGLRSGTTYHYRVSASNGTGSGRGEDLTLTAAQPPSVDSLYSQNVTEDSADLVARINPHGADTTYQFEYGTTPTYGTSIPVQPTDVGSGVTPQEVSAHLGGLESGITYHFRIVAHSVFGTTLGEDQSFSFAPANCPNAHLRQETHSSSLPDCRAYELVSPSDANGVVYNMSASQDPGAFSDGGATFNSPDAVSPARLGFTSIFGALPGTKSGNFGHDLYVATRTNSGWVTRYVGVAADTALGSAGAYASDNMGQFVQTRIIRPAPDKFYPAFSFPSDLTSATGEHLATLPTNLATIPDTSRLIGDTRPSPDFTHFVFSTGARLSLAVPDEMPSEYWPIYLTPGYIPFAPDGRTSPPGSVYDNDIASGTVVVASKTAAVSDIPQEPGNEDPHGYLQIPAISTDGSHILIASASNPSCEGDVKVCAGQANQAGFGGVRNPVHLYMRVDDSLTYDVTLGHAVTYNGMTSDGSLVYFTSAERLTPDDQDASADVFVWSLATDTISRVSIGAEGSGNSNECQPSHRLVKIEGTGALKFDSGPWTGSCSVSLQAIDPVSGDSYFLSPELLDGLNGIAGEENLYRNAHGAVQYVASFDPGSTCTPPTGTTDICRPNDIRALTVAAGDQHIALITSGRLTSYDSAGHSEMYRYDTANSRLFCVSCIPNGAPPSAEVSGSTGGLPFMSTDGRVFFYTADALSAQDTNELGDVYEYVDGRPQLITPGTGAHDRDSRGRSGGLFGVSADGANVYFATFDTVVGQDHNGANLKFYDARTGGGFPFSPPVAPCAAADECHGAGSAPPVEASLGSTAGLGGSGNVAARNAHPKHKHRHKPKVVQRHHHARRTGSSKKGLK